MLRTLLATLALAGASLAPRRWPRPPWPAHRQPAPLAGFPAGRRQRPLGLPPELVLRRSAGDRDRDPVQGRRGGGPTWAQMKRCRRTGLTSSARPAVHRAAADGRQCLVQDRGRDTGALVPLDARRPRLRGTEPDQDLGRFVKAAKADLGKLDLGGSGLNSANHVAPSAWTRRSRSR